MDIGKSSNNTRRHIDVTGLATAIGKEIYSALPGFHAFSGCDYTASFMRKGKGCPFEIMKKSKDFISTFSRLGQSSEIPEDLVSKLEHYVCTLYGKGNVTKNVKEAQLALFRQYTAPTKRRYPLKRIKNSDPSFSPPCKSVLVQKFK